MRIALLQDEIFLPSFAGGIKANRLLLTDLAQAGHSCLAFSRALTRSPDGPNDLEQFRGELDSRNLQVQQIAPEVFTYTTQRVQVEAMNHGELDDGREYLKGRLKQFAPDCVFVADDKRRFMLPSAAAAAPGRYVPLLQTIMQLPFGPLSVDQCAQQTQLMSAAPAIVVISEFMQRYLWEYGSLESFVLPMPVYGAGPFANFACHDRGYVTMINPCHYKGVSIFQDLARQYPEIPFAAVPTWGADPEIRRELAALPNVSLLDPCDEIDEILSQTRILLVPSLWPESFGYVVPEAMLRGIPVLASDLGGLPEAKRGVEYLLPVSPAVRQGDRYISPLQDTAAWSQALGELLGDANAYAECSHRSRAAALEFVRGVSIKPFEQMVANLSPAPTAKRVR